MRNAEVSIGRCSCTPRRTKLRKQFPGLCDTLQPSGFGENVLVRGINERNVCIGDEYAVGEAILQVASPRAPCVVINKFHQTAQLKQYASENALAGWFCRVLVEGRVSSGDSITLLSRPHPEWNLHRMQVALHASDPTPELLSEIISLKPTLATYQWGDRAEMLLKAAQSRDTSSGAGSSSNDGNGGDTKRNGNNTLFSYLPLPFNPSAFTAWSIVPVNKWKKNAQLVYRALVNGWGSQH
eukprot:NODE_2258_length_1249_cov_15.532500_g2057_i0.p1 GENE.NODE_2258_length_1249_cov_15.532500_g2057_i0~~NODE_2258_length_1249_cov_15.532500_g2057_i0.p1  ORF type:complete len:240 (-),score=33.49 NODE_2258_length_1249_cov_15.532500_g2057_i0:301-1020(-)